MGGLAKDIYRSDNLLVRMISSNDTSRWVVTFDHYGSPRTFDRPGFGEQFFVERDVSLITVLARGNDWFQYDDVPAALAAIGKRVDGATRVMTYGSSMGGYAAIRFADAIGANVCLSLSPQYSIDPRKAPFEKRWPQESSTIRWHDAIDGPIACSIKPIVMFDPRIDDGRHVELIARDTAIEAIPASYTAHPITTFLNAGGLLEQAIFELLHDRFEPEELRRRIVASRSSNMVYLGELARRQPPHRSRLGIALARKALAAAPGNDLAMHTLGKRLTDAGQHEEALGLHKQAVEISNGHLGYSLPYSEALHAAGRNEAAFALATQLARTHPEYAQVHGWLAHLSWISGDGPAARERIKIAVTLDPRNTHYKLNQLLYAVPAGARLRSTNKVVSSAANVLANWLKGRQSVSRA